LTSKTSVYLLTFQNGKRYVGLSAKPDLRWKQHCSESAAASGRMKSGGSRAVSAAIKKYGAEAVVMEVLSTYPTRELAAEAEKGFIKSLGTFCPSGYNMTEGGEGVLGLPEHIRKESGRKRSERHKTDPEFAAKMRDASKRAGPKVSVALTQWWATPASAALRAQRSSPEAKAAAAARNENRAPETAAKISKKTAQNWSDPEYRSRINAARDAAQAKLRASDPEWTAKRKAATSASMKAKWQDPEYIAKRKASQSKPETRARMLEGSRKKKTYDPDVAAARAEKLRQARLANWADPAYRERMTAIMRASRESRKLAKESSTTSK
jgi:group I intron endonuclease